MKTLTTFLTTLVIIFIAACANQQPIQLGVNDPDDYGIGGTGIMAGNQQGSGIIGMITGYGSIFVNGIEIETENQATISVDGTFVKAHKFEIGEVVEVLTRDTNAHSQAQHINIRHEIIGPVSSYDSEQAVAVILGKTIKLSDTINTGIKPGDSIAVSGFTDAAGLIHATHISHTTASQQLLRDATQSKELSLPFNKVAKWVIQGYSENYTSKWNIQSTNLRGRDNDELIIFEVTNPGSASETINVMSQQNLQKGANSKPSYQQMNSPGRSLQPGRQSGSGGHGRK